MRTLPSSKARAAFIFPLTSSTRSPDETVMVESASPSPRVKRASGRVKSRSQTPPEARLTRGDGEALSTITVSPGDLVELVSGKMNAARAFELGKVRMAGDIARVVAVGQILLG